MSRHNSIARRKRTVAGVCCALTARSIVPRATLLLTQHNTGRPDSGSGREALVDGEERGKLSWCGYCVSRRQLLWRRLQPGGGAGAGIRRAACFASGRCLDRLAVIIPIARVCCALLMFFLSQVLSLVANSRRLSKSWGGEYGTTHHDTAGPIPMAGRLLCGVRRYRGRLWSDCHRGPLLHLRGARRRVESEAGLRFFGVLSRSVRFSLFSNPPRVSKQRSVDLASFSVLLWRSQEPLSAVVHTHNLVV